MTPIRYPKWLYHAEHEARIVDGEEAHEALGPGWEESPADLKPRAPEPEQQSPFDVIPQPRRRGGGRA